MFAAGATPPRSGGGASTSTRIDTLCVVPSSSILRFTTIGSFPLALASTVRVPPSTAMPPPHDALGGREGVVGLGDLVRPRGARMRPDGRQSARRRGDVE